MNDDLERVLERAEQRQSLSKDDIIYLLDTSAEDTEPIFRVARMLRSKYFRNEIFLYGFIYFSNWCRNDCAFCYYRKSNRLISRYSKTDIEVVDAAASLRDSGVNLIDLTSGEDVDYRLHPEGYERLTEMVRRVKAEIKLPVMVSPGFASDEALQQLAAAGADWYACYQETHNRKLFKQLRLNQSFDKRWRAKVLARRYGMLVEEGLLKGVGETSSDIADSFSYMERIGAQQVRVMSFVPQVGTPMENWSTPDRIEELKVIAVMRLLFPDRLIPASLDVDGVSGLQARLEAGANVVTSLIPPNLGLAGVAQSSKDINDGYRTVAGILPLLEQLGLEPAAPGRYSEWVETEKRKLIGQDIRKQVAMP